MDDGEENLIVANPESRLLKILLTELLVGQTEILHASEMLSYYFEIVLELTERNHLNFIILPYFKLSLFCFIIITRF